MKVLSALLIAICSIFLFSSMNIGLEDDDELGLIVRYKKSHDGKKLFKYYYQDYDTLLLSAFQIDSISKMNHGISYSFDNGKDTSRIGYYKMGVSMPMDISLYYRDGNRYVGVTEIVDNSIMIDAWRENYNAKFIDRNDSTFIAYFLEGKVVFRELFYWGEKKSRTVVIQSVFDSIVAAYNNKTGAQIYQESCTSCHNPYKDATGPKLAGITKRRSEDWLRKWIRNSSKLIVENDPIAVSIYNQWYKTAMTSHLLPDAEMDKLITFLKTL